jgi:hypothetical protein
MEVAQKKRRPEGRRFVVDRDDLLEQAQHVLVGLRRE